MLRRRPCSYGFTLEDFTAKFTVTTIRKGTYNSMNRQPKNGEKDAATPLPRLYLRPDEAARAIGVSRRTLSTWQSARLIGFRRVGRTVLISVADILAAIERYRIAPLGEPKRPQQHVDVGTITALTTPDTSQPPRRKRRMQRTASGPAAT